MNHMTTWLRLSRVVPAPSDHMGPARTTSPTTSPITWHVSHRNASPNERGHVVHVVAAGRRGVE
jgi:hypothetical protein